MRRFNILIIEGHNNIGLTLIELLIAISIFALIVVGFSSIDTFSRYHVMSSDRRAKLQNDASYVLEHMAKYIGQGIGDETNPPDSRAVNLTDIGGDTAIRIYVDLDSDGQSPGDGQRGTGGDHWRAYRFTGTVGSNGYQIWYYPNYVNPSSSYEILSRRIATFTRTPTDNYVDIQVAARWQPGQAASVDNPEITLRNRINMPSVSTH